MRFRDYSDMEVSRNRDTAALVLVGYRPYRAVSLADDVITDVIVWSKSRDAVEVYAPHATITRLEARKRQVRDIDVILIDPEDGGWLASKNVR